MKFNKLWRGISLSLLSVALLLSKQVVKAEQLILDPPQGSEQGSPIAVIWIHGMQCNPQAYKSIAQAFQDAASQSGYKAWVGAPEFIFDVPEPILIDHYVSDMINELKDKHGFTGDKIYMASHSLGGVMAQDYIKSNPDLVKGSILMGSVLLRGKRNITDSGETHFDYQTPTLTLLGEKDGLLRISRGAEAFWHQQINIVKNQQNDFPVVYLKGASHASFMDSSMLPSAVKDSDLKPEVDENQIHATIGQTIVSFIDQINGGNKTLDTLKSQMEETNEFMQPLIDGMILEGSYSLKDPCYGNSLINPNDPKCLKGAPWTQFAQSIMGGNIDDKNTTIYTDDNFHRVYTVTPVHLPQVNNTCDGSSKCDLNTVSVTENYYVRLNEFDTGKYEIGASEMKAKLLSRQSIQTAAGNKTADFHEDDEVGSRCAEINQEALNWALKHANPSSLERYNRVGKKLVIGSDLGPYNAGPLWIWYYMQYKDNADKTETLLQSPMMRTPTDYPIAEARGFHYCKLLSPFRALEWIYVDSLYDRDGIKSIHNNMNIPTLSDENFLQY